MKCCNFYHIKDRYNCIQFIKYHEFGWGLLFMALVVGIKRVVGINFSQIIFYEELMKHGIIWANLGVKHIERTQKFYLALGFKLNGQPTEDLVSFLFGDNQFIIHFFAQDRFKSSLEGGLSDLGKGNEIMFSLSVATKDDYDRWINEIKNAGGTVLFDSNIDRKEYYDKNGFYVCVFTDPDGHKFNLLYSDNM